MEKSDNDLEKNDREYKYINMQVNLKNFWKMQ